MNRLDSDKRIQLVQLLCEGMSMRAACRCTGVARNTALKLLVDLGSVCSAYQSRVLRSLSPSQIQIDEIWQFVGCKQKNIPSELEGQHGCGGDVYTFVAMDAETKLVINWMLGPRDACTTDYFISDLANRIKAQHVPQISTDGFPAYPEAIDRSFGENVDYARVIKTFRAGIAGEARYSPPECTGEVKQIVIGKPNSEHISTSYIERQNLTMRMHMRRFTRLTNAFSKKLLNHSASVALHFMFYNFVKIHGSLRVTPAMAAGVTGKLWEISDIIELLAGGEPRAKSVWSYKRAA